MRVWSIPLRTRFRGITVREGILLRGEQGWGEWSPFLEYPPDVAEPWLRCAEEAAAGDWPAPVRDVVPVNVTVPAVGPERAHAIVLAGGCATAKVKVAEPGQTLADDEARVEAVRDALGPGGRVRVDANGAWTIQEAVAAIAALDRAAGGLEYVEQPCAGVEDLAAVRRAVGVPIAADESIRRAADPYRVRDLEAVVDHILHVIDVAGEDVPALGSDFDGFVVPPVGLEDVGELPNLTAALSRRGLPDRVLAKIVGGNVLRVLDAVPPTSYLDEQARPTL